MIRVRVEVVRNTKSAAEGKNMTGMAVVCLAYYVVLRLAMGKWNSTFAIFWLVSGVGFLGVKTLGRLGPEWLEEGIGMIFPVAIFLCMLTEIRIFLESIKKERICEYVIVLGAHIEGICVTNSLRRRLDKAIDYAKRYPDVKIIVSGGQGKGEDITEAEAMKTYLVERGIPSCHIWEENRSKTTRENLQYSAAFLPGREAAVGIVTNNFHIYRAKQYARRLGYQNPIGISAGCNRVLLPNYLTRELFAIGKMYLMG